MEVSVHRVTDIKLKRTQYNSFNTVTVTVTDQRGAETEFTLYSDNNNHIEIGEDE